MGRVAFSMKKLRLGVVLIAVCIVAVIIFLITRNLFVAQIELGESDIFTQEEIIFAMDVVKEEFAERFGRRGRLNSLHYQGDFSTYNTISIMSLYHQWHYGNLGHGWRLSRECLSEPWVIVSGPFPGNMGHGRD